MQDTTKRIARHSGTGVGGAAITLLVMQLFGGTDGLPTTQHAHPELATGAAVAELRKDVDELREDVEEIREDIGEIREDIAGIRTTVANLQTLEERDIKQLREDITWIRNQLQ